MLKQLHLLIIGKVQGVGFRYTVREQAQALSLFGWVKNLPSGQVEILAQGEAGDLNKLLTWVKTSSDFTQIDDVEVEWQSVEEKFSDFTIDY